MNIPRLFIGVCLVVCSTFFCPVYLVAQTINQDSLKVGIEKIPAPKVFTSLHQMEIKGQSISYEAKAQEIYLTNEKGASTASIWSVSYLKQGVEDISKRPVTFVFNGGPGSASVWLHMGLLGPKLVRVPGEAEADDGAPPYPIDQNPHCLLDITDLVFVDPVGTGYSKVIGNGKVEEFWGLMEDARSIAQFIRMWVTMERRWNAPKYIAGESFGTTRAAAVAQELLGGGQDMAVNGLIMISQALDYAGSTSVHYNITSYLTYLPAMAATSWYHKRAGQGKSLETFVEEARQFTYRNYAPALYQGHLIDSSEFEQILQKLQYFTGLSEQYVRQSNLRVLVPRYQKELLRDQGLTIGRLDGRYFSTEADQVAERPTLGDPASYGISSAYTAALQSYYATDLQIEMNRPYLTSNRKIYPKWNWKPLPKSSGWEPSFVNTAPQLGNVMRKNTEMRVLVCSGYYDLITPFFDAEYTFSRNGIVPERVTFTYYEGGHMMYTHQDDLPKICQDIRDFMTQ